MSDDELTHNRIVTGDDGPTAEELIEMVRTYATERLAEGQAALCAPVGSVKWNWGRVVVDEMTALLEVAVSGRQ